MDLHGSIMGSNWIPGSLPSLLQVAKVPTLIKPKKISMIPMRITWLPSCHLISWDPSETGGNHGKPTWTYQELGHPSWFTFHMAIFMGTRLFKIIWGPTGAPYVQTMSYEALQVDDVFRKRCVLTPVNKQKTSKNDGFAFWSVVDVIVSRCMRSTGQFNRKSADLFLLFGTWDIDVHLQMGGLGQYQECFNPEDESLRVSESNLKASIKICKNHWGFHWFFKIGVPKNDDVPMMFPLKNMENCKDWMIVESRI